MKKFGDRTLDEIPFNEVDSLILCQLSYLNFENLVPEYSDCIPVYGYQKFKGDYTDFYWQSAWIKEMNNFSAFIYVLDSNYAESLEQSKIDQHSILYSPICMDCRKVQNATKKRPDFWPNNHE